MIPIPESLAETIFRLRAYQPSANTIFINRSSTEELAGKQSMYMEWLPPQQFWPVTWHMVREVTREPPTQDELAT
jgi:hypothetical protein